MDVLFYTQYCSVVDVWCDGRPISHTVWWMSFFTHGVVDVCVDVAQSMTLKILRKC